MYARTTVPGHITSTAEWRQLGLTISNAFASGGLVKAADTGQVDWATTTAWTSGAVVPLGSYEIWRFADALQSTVPVFFRIDYYTYAYSSTSTTQALRYTISIGAGSNGAGTITGLMATINSYQLSGSAPNLTPGGEALFNITSSRCFFGLGMTNDGFSPLYFHLERPQNSTGTLQPDGAILSWGGGASAPPSWGGYVFLAFGLANPATSLSLPFPGSFNSGQRGLKGADVAVMVPIYYLGKPFYSPLFVALPNDAVPTGSTVTISVLGSARQYFVMSRQNLTTSAFVWYHLFNQSHPCVLAE